MVFYFYSFLSWACPCINPIPYRFRDRCYIHDIPPIDHINQSLSYVSYIYMYTCIYIDIKKKFVPYIARQGWDWENWIRRKVSQQLSVGNGGTWRGWGGSKSPLFLLWCCASEKEENIADVVHLDKRRWGGKKGAEEIDSDPRIISNLAQIVALKPSRRRRRLRDIRRKEQNIKSLKPFHNMETSSPYLAFCPSY